jgi:hypothetical protein
MPPPVKIPAKCLVALFILLALGVPQILRAQDDVYAAEFDQTNNQFGTINLFTGTFTPIGSYGSAVINDIAYAPNGTLYGIEGNNLVTFNLKTAAITTVGTFNVGGLESLAFQPGTGTLYAASQGALYTVNTTTATTALVGNFGTPTGLNDNGQNIRFAADGDLYDTNTSTNGTSTGLYHLSLTSGSATFLGNVQGYVNLVLANAGDQLYGVSINVTGSSSTQQTLIGFNLTSLDSESSAQNITVTPLDGQANIPSNFNFSGGQDAAAPDFNEQAIPEPASYALVLFGLGGFVLRRIFRPRSSTAPVKLE